MAPDIREPWQLTVETYDGYKAEESPRRFRFGQQELEVVEIVDRWYGPGESYFKVLAGDGNHYVLKNRRGAWTLESFQRAAASQDP